jgi:hypothetical protein
VRPLSRERALAEQVSADGVRCGDRADILGVVRIDYASPGRLTELGNSDALAGLDGAAFDVCWPVHDLVISPSDAQALGLASERFEENQIRPAASLLERLLALDSSPLITARAHGQRVIGSCRHFAVLACALLRHRRITSRVRCGFATYFQPSKALDHWIVEHREPAGRWVRLDPEVLARDVVEHPEDLAPGAFMTGVEAWQAYRRGDIDATTFGVYGTDNFGPGEIRGNLVKDLAALNKVEMLPWDEWGRMTDAYEGATGEDYDELLDEVANACAADRDDDIRDLFQRPDLCVPERLLN